VNSGAHVLLPAAAWGEKDGTVTNSERRISRQRAFLPLPGESKPDWQIVAEVGSQMGFADAFAYRTAADVFREHAALSGFENAGARDFDIGALAAISDNEYDALTPVQWPVPAGTPPIERRFFAEGGFFTADRKGRFIAPEPPALQEATSPDFPLRLNTGRIRDQWHTMTRTGMSPRLATHLPEPFVTVHPDDAARTGLTDGGFARVSTAHGACIVKVVVSDDQRAGSLFLPIHWSGETASSARAGDLVAACTDPYSGQPEAKATPAAIAPIEFKMRGFIRSRQPIAMPNATWWTRVATADAHEYRVAADHGPMMWHDFAYGLLATDAKLAEHLDQRTYRAAMVVDGDMDGVICIGPADQPVNWGGLDGLEVHDDGGAPITAISMMETEPVVCACFGIGIDSIRNAITCGAASTVTELGQVTRAGTNCGSCLPELKRIVTQERAKARAAASMTEPAA
jgi:assimilatory nitrate reductase catalytic subunit